MRVEDHASASWGRSRWHPERTADGPSEDFPNSSTGAARHEPPRRDVPARRESLRVKAHPRRAHRRPAAPVQQRPAIDRAIPLHLGAVITRVMQLERRFAECAPRRRSQIRGDRPEGRRVVLSVGFHGESNTRHKGLRLLFHRPDIQHPDRQPYLIALDQPRRHPLSDRALVNAIDLPVRHCRDPHRGDDAGIIPQINSLERTR